MDGALAQVSALLSSYLSAKAADAGHPELTRLAQLLAGFVTGGKGLRPQLCVAGWLAGGGSGPGLASGGDTDAVVHAAASLELFHAFALIQDDVMDGSATRRGKPAMHCALTAGYPGGGDTDRKALQFGLNGAILLGDLALVWSDELLAAAPLSDAQREAIEPVIRMMRSEAIFGQYLDLLATGRQDGDVDATLTVARYKTGSYTVHRPLQLGAVLAGAGPEVLPACRAVGVPLGEAFQLRDDLLGVFGDPARTGKSRLDDLREGKHTTLMALALQRADPEQARRLRRLVGDPELGEAGASAVREILEGTGARDEVERMIRTRYEKARAALRDAPFAPAGSAALAGLASRAVVRDS
jgi:geranylgeranyl diphosphate synthase type I